METVLFGQAQLGVKYGTSRTRLAIACRIYQEVCTLLLQSLESLQLSLQHLSGLIPDLQRPSVRIIDCRKRMKKLIEIAQTVETEDDFLMKANSDISQLCAENILLWNKFLDAFTLREVIRKHLAQINHNHRVKRFSEGFFTMTNPKKSALCCLDAKHQHYMVVSEAVRRSGYFMHLPNLQVSCKELDGTSDTLPIIFEDIYSDGIPKRNSFCDNVRLLEGCILVNSTSEINYQPCQDIIHTDNMRNITIRPSSVPLNLDITAIKQHQTSDLGNLSQESLDRLKRDLSILVQATKNATNEPPVKEKKGKKKKISLPLKLTDERLTSTLPSDAKSKIDRKRSIDSSLNLLSPTLSPDMKMYFKEKLKNNLKLDVKHKKNKDKMRNAEAKFQKGVSGYSHLECCANIPYNLEEEPELFDGMKNPKVKNGHDQSFTSQTLQSQESHACQAEVKHPCRSDNWLLLSELEPAKKPMKENSKEICEEVCDQESKKVKPVQENQSKSPVISKKSKANLEGMAKVREIVLSNSKYKESDEDSSESSISEASGWVSNNSRRSSSSTTETSCENQSQKIPTSSKNREKQPEGSAFKRASDVKDNKASEKVEKKPVEYKELKSPGMLLSKSARSRSEEPAEKKVVSPVVSRPRHRSESVMTRSFSPVRKFSNTQNISDKNVQSKPPLPEIIKTEHKNEAVPPPEEFRDPPKDLKLENIVRESNFAKVRHKKFIENKSHSVHNDPIVISFDKPTDRPDVKKESEIAIQKLYEAVSEITSDKKMSRSNTISFGDEAIDNDEKKFSDKVSEIRRRKQNSAENLLSQRLSSSMQGINRNFPDTIMETKNLPALQQPTIHPDILAFTCCDWIPNKLVLSDEKMSQKIAYMYGIEMVNYLKYREEFKKLTSFPGALYSDRGPLGYSYPYFTKATDLTIEVPKASHLIVCVHGLDGNSADLRLVKTYLEMALPSSNLDFLMSEINQMDTFLSFEDMTKKLVNEIMYHVKTCDLNIGKISFIGHSLGCILIRSAIQRPELVNFSKKFHTFLSLSGPHIGTMYNNSGLVNAGMWVMQRWKKSGSLQQLALKDEADIRKTFMYKLAEKSNLHFFKNVLLAGSSQDKYVPIHSARIELCKAAIKDNSVTGAAYKEMVHNILGKVVESDVELVRYDIHHALPNNTNSLIGRAAHIAVLDSELFIEKFLVIAVLKYFQ
eukprot:TRINITY_DN18611_c0_g1_i1.p1 TRINITY_DN18611_c0_g1~~TRINITY_DN18611_c0_g1_i1.p1  ORF type:complete len:1338 (-),score=331.89 TRINITY_DN18611_c0_g1_i1:1056-4637(-)